MGVVEDAIEVALEASLMGGVHGSELLMWLNWTSQISEAEKQRDARIISPRPTGDKRSLQARHICLKSE